MIEPAQHENTGNVKGLTTAEILLYLKLPLLKLFQVSFSAVAISNMSIEMSFSIDNDKFELGKI